MSERSEFRKQRDKEVSPGRGRVKRGVKSVNGLLIYGGGDNLQRSRYIYGVSAKIRGDRGRPPRTGKIESADTWKWDLFLCFECWGLGGGAVLLLFYISARSLVLHKRGWTEEF